MFQIAFQVLKGGAAAEPKEAEVEQIKRASENKAPAQQKVSIKVDLELHVAHGAKGINCHWIYNEALVSEQRIQRMADNYLRLLQSVLQGLNLSHEPRLGQLEAISQAEQERLLYLWNDNDTRFPDTMQIQ